MALLLNTAFALNCDSMVFPAVDGLLDFHLFLFDQPMACFDAHMDGGSLEILESAGATEYSQASIPLLFLGMPGDVLGLHNTPDTLGNVFLSNVRSFLGRSAGGIPWRTGGIFRETGGIYSGSGRNFPGGIPQVEKQWTSIPL